jgi:uncharacterized membrane protein
MTVSTDVVARAIYARRRDLMTRKGQNHTVVLFDTLPPSTKSGLWQEASTILTQVVADKSVVGEAAILAACINLAIPE